MKTLVISLAMFAGAVTAGLMIRDAIYVPTDAELQLEEYQAAARLEREKRLTERERQQTAVVLARLRKDELQAKQAARVENAPEVIRARIKSKAFLAAWPFWGMSLAGAAGILAVAYAAIRRVEFSAAGVATFVTRRQAAVLAERALYLQGLTEEARIAAFQEQIGRERFQQGVSLFAALGRAWKSGVTAVQAALPEAIDAPQTAGVVSFREMVQAGKFAAGKPLLFGFEKQSNAPRTGTWEDCPSLGVAGQSGCGKSATIRLLAAESLLTGAVERIWIIDLHWPHPKSLTASLGALRDAPQVTYAENKADVPRILAEVNAEIDARLQNKKPSEPAVVLIIDELIPASKIDGVPQMLEKIGTESRKAGVYGLFAAQSWNADRVGGTTARDNLGSLLVHCMKKKPANVLLQDAELAQQVTRLRKGEAMFVPAAGGEPEILTIPFASKEDMQEVVSRLNAHDAAPRQANTSETTQDTGANVTRPEQATGALHAETPVERAETARNVISFEQKRAAKRAETLDERHDTAETAVLSDSDLREQTNALLDAKRETLSGLATKTGVNKGGLYRFLRQNDHPSDTLRAALCAFLAAETAVKA